MSFALYHQCTSRCAGVNRIQRRAIGLFAVTDFIQLYLVTFAKLTALIHPDVSLAFCCYLLFSLTVSRSAPPVARKNILSISDLSPNRLYFLSFL